MYDRSSQAVTIDGPWETVKILNIFWHNILPDSIAPEKQDGSNSTASMFREQLKFITNIYTPISISDFVEISDNPRLQRSFMKPPVILGFDDGFRNVITEGLPILNEFKIPAAFFVTAAILKDPEFVPWFVELKHLLRRTENPIIRYGALSINLSSQQDRIKLLHLFETSFKACRSETNRQRMLAEFAEILGVDRPLAADLDEDLRFITKEDLAAIDSASLLTIASHAMTHRHLDSLTYEEQVAELKESDSLLRQCSACYYPVIAYPNGCFNADTIAIARKIYNAGFATFMNASYRNRYRYQRIGIARVFVKDLAYLLSPLRLNFLLPLKRLLHVTGIRKA